MKTKELAVLLISSLMAFGMQAHAGCSGRGASSGTGWGFTCDSAQGDAEREACRGCHRNDESCGDIINSSCDDGWFYSTAWVAIECCSTS